MTKTEPRNLQKILHDYKIVDDSVCFIEKCLDELYLKLDKVISNPTSPKDEFIGISGQISVLLKKSKYEIKKLNELEEELKLLKNK